MAARLGSWAVISPAISPAVSLPTPPLLHLRVRSLLPSHYGRLPTKRTPGPREQMIRDGGFAELQMWKSFTKVFGVSLAVVTLMLIVLLRLLFQLYRLKEQQDSCAPVIQENITHSRNETIAPCTEWPPLTLKTLYFLPTDNVILDQKTASPHLRLSQDQKRVEHRGTIQDLPDNPERFDKHPCVLGSKGFNSGRHYWEVKVELGQNGYWSVGAARESVRRKGGLSQWPGEGIWAIERLWQKGHYEALTFKATRLHPKENLQKLGVYLNYEAGTLSLLNADTMEHLFTFFHSFSQKIFPYFWVGEKACLELV